VRFSTVCALAFAAFLTAPGSAYAFCRTTTVHEPIGFNPVESGCWTAQDAVPIAWAGGQHVEYQIPNNPSRYISLSDAARIAQLAFQQWNTAPCEGGAPNVQFSYGGPAAADAAANDCGLHQCDATVHDTQHLIVFDDAGWPHNDPNNTLAITTVTYGVDSGEIYDADIEINTSQHAITAQEPPPEGSYDLQAILTHEAGHFLGLAHATSTTPVMYAQYKPGAIKLTQDDIDGVCSIYPPVSKAGCSCTSAPESSGAWALALSFGLTALLVARKRRRARV
jgi:MYXO-CTERM domain-containing protein